MPKKTKPNESVDWHIAGLRDLTERLRGKTVSDELWLCLRAVDDRQFYAEYHAYEVVRIVGEALGGRDFRHVIEGVVLGDDAAAQEDFLIPRKQAWAHVLACLQTLHATVDIMGHVLVFALGLRLKGRISMDKARKEVKDPVLAEMLDSWLGHDDHVYLNAAVNFSKHHSLVRETLSVDLSGARLVPFGLALSPFRYEKRDFSQRWAFDVIGSFCDREMAAVAQIGRRINLLLAAEEAAS